MADLSSYLGRFVVVLLLLAAGLTDRAVAQGLDPENRPVRAIEIVGLEEVPEQLVRNQIRTQVGDPYQAQRVEQDIVRITHLGRFDQVRASVQQLEDGSVRLIFTLSEQPLLADVRVEGNKAISDENLLENVRLRTGDAADPFLIDQGLRQIEQAYRDKGFFVADATVDQQLLQDSNILAFQVREGPKVKIRGIRFEGNDSYADGQLASQIKSDEYFPIFAKGLLSREQLELDAASIREFYQERGYLDAQVGRRIDLSPNQKDAIVTFLVDEGPQYTIGRIDVQGAQVFPQEQIRMNLDLSPGSVFSTDRARRSRERLLDLYGKLGYLETRANIQRVFHQGEPKVDLIVEIEEGAPATVGTVSVRGNAVTKNKVILRQVRGMSPGRPFDRSGVDETRRRLRESPLFADATVTILGGPEDEVRDVLLDVQETNTGSILFGAGVSSDAGVIGAIELTQRNFDISDLPESWEEAITGQAFRGAGQYFSLSLQPGDETSRYSIDFREPFAFETNYFFEAGLFFFNRERQDYNEERYGGTLGIGQRFGDVWSAAVRGRFNEISIDDIEPDAPVDVFAVEGGNTLTSLGFEVRRDTTDSAIQPSRGTRLDLGIERIGALGGDFDFTRVRGEFWQFWTVDEDFFGRKSILGFRLESGYILEDDEAPTFERFFAGGHRSFRGFDFRGVGPRGVRADTGTLGDDAVGGDFLLLASLEYTFPLYEDFVRGAVFTDQGTVQEDFGIDDWRVSVGAGLRIRIPFLGQAPFAIDFAIPVVEQEGDEDRLVSFDLAIPFR